MEEIHLWSYLLKKAIRIHLPWTKRTVPTTAATVKMIPATMMPIFF